MMKLTSPYRNIKQNTNISIEPYYMNSDIRNNMKIVLKKKVEKKCNENGYIDEVYRIMKYEDGDLIAENLSGNVIFNVSYHCKICIPIENTIIIGHVKVINQEVIVCINGPIMIFITKDNIDTNIWEISDGYMHKPKKEKLAVGQYIKIHILNKNINQGDVQVKAIGIMLDYATPTELTKYYGNIVEETPLNENVDDTENSFII
jgi:DNA-directed RNA polymerase subunit E'/Rpb7